MRLIDSIIRQPVRVAFGRNSETSGDTVDVVALDSTRDSDSATITAADGSFVVIPAATETTAGILTAADKALVGIAALHYESAAEVANAAVPAQRGYLRTWGYWSPGDGGGALYKRVASEPSHPGKVQSADGAWWELVEGPLGYVAKQLGATGDGSTDDHDALEDALSFGSVLLPSGTYNTAAEVTATDTLRKLIGSGWHEDASRNIEGSRIIAASTAVATLLHIASSSPASQGSTDVQGLVLEDFALLHRGSDAGLKIENVVRPRLRNVDIECNDEGAVGLELDHWSFFATMDALVIRDFTDTGVKLLGEGSEYIMRDCHVRSNHASAVAAVETQAEGVSIIGGQINVNNASGIGVHFNNPNSANAFSKGSIENLLIEHGDTGVLIEGTDYWDHVELVRLRCDFSIFPGTLVRFGNARWSVLRDPQIDRANAGGTLAEWHAASVDCGVVCNRMAARAPIVVQPGATRPWMRVTGHIELGMLSEIAQGSGSENLLVIVEEVVGLGECRRIGGVWDRGVTWIGDDAVASIDVPPAMDGMDKTGGRLSLICRTEPNASAEIWYERSSSIVEAVSGSFVTVDSGLGATTGTAGNNGDLTISYDSADHKIYVENRTGRGHTFKWMFDPIY